MWHFYKENEVFKLSQVPLYINTFFGLTSYHWLWYIPTVHNPGTDVSKYWLKVKKHMSHGLGRHSSCFVSEFEEVFTQRVRKRPTGPSFLQPFYKGQ